MSETNGVLFDFDAPDEGYETVKLPDGGEMRIDVYDFNNQIAAVQDETRDQPNSTFHQRVIELMKAAGLPEVSHARADRFALAVIKRAGELAGKAGSVTDAPAG